MHKEEKKKHLEKLISRLNHINGAYDMEQELSLLWGVVHDLIELLRDEL